MIVSTFVSHLLCFDVLDVTSKRCEFKVEDKDNTTCTFSDIMDSYEFHRELIRISVLDTVNVTRIKFTDSFMDNIPKELFSSFTKLLHLDASNVELERLENYDLMTGSPLISLNVSNNKITKLGARIVGILKDLESLDVSHNRIERINPTTFIATEKFKYLNLSHNKIVKLSESFLYPLRNLEVLRLDHNLIDEITGNFEGFKPNWEELYLQHNKLKSINPILFNNVIVLDLSLNFIGEAKLKNSKILDLKISANELNFLAIGKNLEQLDASSNTENSMHISFEDNKILKYLDLSETNLKGKDETLNYLRSLKQLEYLDLSDTQFNLDASHFKGLNSLKTLLLQGSINREIPSKSFVDLKNLEKLDISENSIASFDLKELKNSKKLEVLKMGNSGISQMFGWENISVLLPNLKTIDIYRNRINCNELLKIVDELRTLKLEVVELDENGEEEFLNQSCVEKPFTFTAEYLPESDVKVANITWYIVGFIVMSLVVVGIIFANRKFDILDRISDVVTCQSRYPTSSLLREEI